MFYYYVLESELALRGMNKKQLSRLLTSMSYNSLLSKLRGDFKFTLDEALEIRHAIHSEKDIETLFSKSDSNFFGKSLQPLQEKPA